MKTPHTTASQGYAILFAVLIVSIVLAVTLGILNVAVKEFRFTTTARNSHISFFAADTGGECALYGRKNGMMDSATPQMVCDSQTLSSISTALSAGITRFDFQKISVQDGCELVDITVDNSNTQVSTTTINSHGYNVTCAALDADPINKVERLLSYVFTDIGGGGVLGTTTGSSTGGTTTSGTSGAGSTASGVTPPPFPTGSGN